MIRKAVDMSTKYTHHDLSRLLRDSRDCAEQFYVVPKGAHARIHLLRDGCDLCVKEVDVR